MHVRTPPNAHLGWVCSPNLPWMADRWSTNLRSMIPFKTVCNKNSSVKAHGVKGKMFGNKRNNLPPRPHTPDLEHILDDLSKASVQDVAFKIMTNDSERGDNDQPATNLNNTEANYEKAKAYLNVKHRLRLLEETLNTEIAKLQDDNEEIGGLAKGIRNEAQAALAIP